MKYFLCSIVSFAFASKAMALPEASVGEPTAATLVDAPPASEAVIEMPPLKSLSVAALPEFSAQQNYDRAAQAAKSLCTGKGEVAVVQDVQSLNYTSREVQRVAIPQVVYGASQLYVYRRDLRGFYTNQDGIPRPERVVTVERLQVEPKTNQEILVSVLCEKPTIDVKPVETPAVLQAVETQSQPQAK